MKYLKAFMGKEMEGRVHRFWGGHRKLDSMKLPVRPDDFWFSDLLGLSYEGNQE